jgi:NitT/TauT family transport system substrate-binding protein
VPNKIGDIVAFMNKVGIVRTKPESWKDLFFPEVHGLKGS